jgi:hypothetical protein
MKKALILLILVLSFNRLLSQIVIDQSDMPSPGDTLRVSITTSIPLDYTKTAMDTVWDFSGLSPMNQQVDTFVTLQSTPVFFQLAFYNASLASPGGGAILPGIPVTSAFTFYQKSVSAYSDLGFAFLASGLPAILKYDTPDKYYSFPLTTGSLWNSTSTASLGFPGMATYFTSRTRSSTVDGWGTLTTPYGTFPVIRVKTDLVVYDSIHVDTSDVSLPMTRNVTQYKWLAKGKGIPVLEVDEEGPVATAVYRDIFRQQFIPVTVNLGPDTAVYRGSTLTITANVSGGTPPYMYLWSTFELTPSITVTVDTSMQFGVMVRDATNNIGIGTKTVTVMGQGIGDKALNRLQVYPNPCRGNCVIRGIPKGSKGVLNILTAQGTIIKTMVVGSVNGISISLELIDLPAGLYFIEVNTGQGEYYGKIMVGPQ